DLSKDIVRAVAAGYVAKPDSVDPWGKPVIFNGQINGNQAYYQASMDWPGDINNKFWFYVYGVKTMTTPSTAEQKPFDGNVKINEGVGYNASYAQISGQLNKAGNTGIAGARVIVRNRVSNKVFSARTDNGGSFQFNALIPGSYDLIITAAGYY